MSHLRAAQHAPHPASGAILQPVILSGGSGTRLWPLSRQHHPKQLLSPLGGATLLQETCRRLAGWPDVRGPLVVCNEEYRFTVREQLEDVAPPARLILEPMGRNTAPALTLAALLESDRGGESTVLLAMPADHVLTDMVGFHQAISEALPRAADGAVVAFGVRPDRPETGYGYVQAGPNGQILRFVEKPELAVAERFLAEGDYLWNSGIFMVTASAWLREMALYAPDILAACREAVTAGATDGAFFRVGRAAFEACRSDSIDYAVMEKTAAAAVVPLDAGWSDIGAWSALWSVAAHDPAGNVLRGDVLVEDSTDSLMISTSRLVVGLGLRDMVVVETADAVLVVPRRDVQRVKVVAEVLASRKRPEVERHVRVARPWGSFETVDHGAGFQVKRLVINPGASLSLQMHYHRAEHWVVVQGAARVTSGDDVFILTENQSCDIPMGRRHRLENPGNIPLEIIEVQTGHYLGEDDIVRFDDQYQRHLPTQ